MKRLLLAAALAAFSCSAYAQTSTTPSQSVTSTPFGATIVPGTLLNQAAVASLPTCNANTKGLTYAATDLTTPTYGAALVGGGAVFGRVLCNGSAWTSQ